ncbi:MAG TPA: ABC transporter permease, partial [Chryseolinea sp.]|nr:ABC transporter permease [Chryseolinea sp.]
MLVNFLKVILRHLSRSRFFAILNISGLSIGMASCIVIYLYVSNELSYDKFHVDGEKIYRVIRQSRINSMPYNIGVTSAPYAEALKQDYGDRIQSVTRTLAMSSLIKFEDKSFIEEKLLLADRNFFEFFSYPLSKGNAASVLGNANYIVVSRSFARKYFGDADPIGKVLRMDDLYDLQVTGVLDEIPGNTHLQFEAVGSIALANGEAWMKDWWANSFNTYVRVDTRQDADYISKTFPDFMDKYFGRDFERVGNRIGLKLEPLHDIYFNYDTRYEENIKHGDKSYVFVFSSIGILLIILAAINYINLATAQTAERAKEVGIRKTLGSDKGSIAAQFLLESVFLCLTSLGVALALAQVAISFFKSSFGIAIPGLLSDPFLWLFLLLLLIIIS